MGKNRFTETLRTGTSRLSFYTDLAGPKADRVRELQEQLIDIADELDTLLIPEELFDLNITVTR